VVSDDPKDRGRLPCGVRVSQPSISEQPLLSVVIVNWNAGAKLLDCVGSLERHPPSVPWETVLVDNASNDGSVAGVTAAFPAVGVIQNERNCGLAAANNQGIVAAQGDFILITNPDVEYHAGAVDALLDVLRRRPRAAIAVPRLLDSDGLLHTSAGDLPKLSEALVGRRIVRKAGKTSGYNWDGWAHDVETRIGRGQESAYLVRREAIAGVGLQDERFFLDWEGIDWTARMTNAGWEVWFTPGATVTHHGGVSIRQAQLRWVIRSHVGMYRYFAKRRPALRPLLLPVIAARGVVKVGMLAVSGDVYSRTFKR
jgi:GT2 family glycosyltransferase